MNRLFKDSDGFALGGRARAYQRALDTSLNPLREQRKLEGMEAAKQGKLAWQRGMDLARQINDEITPPRVYLSQAPTAQSTKLDKITDWGADLDTPSQAVIELRRASEANQTN